MEQNENRRSARRAIAHTVRIATGVSPPIKCSLLDISEHGARIQVGDPATAPQQFLMQLGNGLTRWCEVIWRSETAIGVKFIERPPNIK